MGELPNRKHELIAREVGLFGVDAFRAWCAQGYAPNRSNASRLVNQPEVAARIAELSAVAMAKAAELAGVDRGRVLAEVARVAYSNIMDFITVEDGVAVMRPLSDIPRDKAATIQAVSYDSNGRLRLKLFDKVGALSSLLKATEPIPAKPAQPEDMGSVSHGWPDAQPASPSLPH